MGSHALIYPVMAQILLTLVLVVATGRARLTAIRAGKVRIHDITLRGDAWPSDVRKLADNMHNQFETPILFFVLCAVATHIGATGGVMTLLAWTYVASRLGHAMIHTTVNDVPRRFQVFVFGLTILASMWVAMALRLLGWA